MPHLSSPGLAKRTFPGLFAKEDKDSLIPIACLNPLAPGIYKVGELVLLAHCYFRRSLSRLNNLNHDVLLELERLRNDGEVSVKIRLDPDAVGLAAGFRHSVEMAYWWGPKFSDDIATIPTGVTRHDADDRQRFYHQVSRTEFWWKSHFDPVLSVQQHTLEAEELCDAPTYGSSHEAFGCRYVHSIVDTPDNHIRHLDGAIREYDGPAMLTRMDRDISKAGKDTTYTKLWRVDGALQLATMKALVHHHFRDNELVSEYLGGGRMPKLVQAESPRPTVQDRLVPFTMSRGDRVRLLISHHPRRNDGNEIRVRPIRSMGPDEIPCFASDIVDLKKLMLRECIELHLPADAMYLSIDDLYSEFPLIVHGSRAELKATFRALHELLSAWEDSGVDRVVALNLAVQEPNSEVWLAIMGHVHDLLLWLRRDECFPPSDQAEASEWVEQAASELSSHGSANDHPPLHAVCSRDGVFLFSRTHLDADTFEITFLPDTNEARPRLTTTNDDPDLAVAISKGELTPRLAVIIGRSVCSSCSATYANCPCVKGVDADTHEIIEDAEPAFAFWTDRPA